MLNTKQFSYNKQTKTFAAEVSELGNFPAERIYSDACDVGFTLVSDRTGRECRYVETDVITDSEGDVQAWVFKAIDKIGSGTKVIIFND